MTFGINSANCYMMYSAVRMTHYWHVLFEKKEI